MDSNVGFDDEIDDDTSMNQENTRGRKRKDDESNRVDAEDEEQSSDINVIVNDDTFDIKKDSPFALNVKITDDSGNIIPNRRIDLEFNLASASDDNVRYNDHMKCKDRSDVKTHITDDRGFIKKMFTITSISKNVCPHGFRFVITHEKRIKYTSRCFVVKSRTRKSNTDRRGDIIRSLVDRIDHMQRELTTLKERLNELEDVNR
jgi:hypothetical protein